MMDERWSSITDGRGQGREQPSPRSPGSHARSTVQIRIMSAGETIPGQTSPATARGRIWAPATSTPTPPAEMAETPLSSPDRTHQPDRPDELIVLQSPKAPPSRPRRGSTTTTSPSQPPAATTKEHSGGGWSKRVIKFGNAWWSKYGPGGNISGGKTSGGGRANSEKKGDVVVAPPMTGTAGSGPRSKVDGRGRERKQERQQQEQQKLLPPQQQRHQPGIAAEPVERLAASPARFASPDRRTSHGAGESDAAVAGTSPPSAAPQFARGESLTIDTVERRPGGDIAVTASGGGGGGNHHLLPGSFPRPRLLANYGSSSGRAITSSDRCPSSEELAEDARMRELRAAFDKFDKDHDGFITPTELGEMLRSLGDEATDEDLAFMIQEVDKNGDGVIDWDEFVSLNTVDARQRERELRAAFGIFDQDKNGVISVQELYDVLHRLDYNCSITIEEVEEMIRKVDSNGDGVVDFEEFKKMMEIDISLSNGLSG
ncbi:hypothetical protein CBR_g17904 [Chara braunii]|uniref:EF-hand domain-containing protein n=1 Tax=Chara braunii TaxID=69332 RepID=A0A388KW33_CHABU|nr:hypothetical protein CBR_g17904 [Chara braunii]|eukprot:GBG74192.1 hypothetical protein CBR_g17904 [Chara braunii]